MNLGLLASAMAIDLDGSYARKSKRIRESRDVVDDAMHMKRERIERLLGCGPLEADMAQREFESWIGEQDTDTTKHWKTEFDVWLDFRVAQKKRRPLIV